MSLTDIPEKVLDLAARVKLLLMDCDGVLTDGRLYFSESGEAMKVFNVRDGQGIAMLHRAGIRTGIVTGRDSEKILRARVDELGMNYLRVRSQDKVKDFRRITLEANVEAQNVAYIGDDVGDIEVMKIAGLPIAVNDAVDEVIRQAAFVTKARGGEGAVREVCDVLMKSRSKD